MKKYNENLLHLIVSWLIATVITMTGTLSFVASLLPDASDKVKIGYSILCFFIGFVIALINGISDKLDHIINEK